MNRSRLGLLAVCSAVLGLMAFGTALAHAEEKALWLILDSNGVLKTKLEASLGLEAESVQVIHTKIAGTSTLFECKKTEGVGAVIKAEGKLSGKMKNSECITKINGILSTACEPRVGKEKGVTISNNLIGLIELHELAGGVKDDVIRYKPEVGETFGTIEMGEECAIGEKVPVIGKMTLKDCENQFLTHLVKHLLEVGPLTELWVISKTAEHAVVTLGSSWAFLLGAHTGLKFAGDPA